MTTLYCCCILKSLLKVWIVYVCALIPNIYCILEYKNDQTFRVGCFEIKNEQMYIENLYETPNDCFQDCYNYGGFSTLNSIHSAGIKPLTDLTYVIAAQNSSNCYCSKIRIPSNQNYHKYLESQFVQKPIGSCDHRITESTSHNDAQLYKVYCPQKESNRLICDILFSLPLIQNLSPLTSHKIELVSECSSELMMPVTAVCRNLNDSVYLESISPACCLNYCKQLQPNNNDNEFYSVISGFIPNATYINSMYPIDYPLPFSIEQIPEWGNCMCYNCANNFEDVNPSHCSNCPNTNYKCGGFANNGITMYSIYKIGKRLEPTCESTWKEEQWISFSYGLVYQNCSGGHATWNCKKNGGFEGIPNFSNCSSMWIQDLDENIQQEDVISAQVSEQLITKFETDLKNHSYHGHEIEKLLNLGVDISQKLDNELPVENLENITARTFDIYGEIIKNTDSWSEIMEKDERAKVGTTILKNSAALTSKLSRRSSRSIKFGSPEEPLQITAGILNDSHNNTLIYPENPKQDETFIEIGIRKNDTTNSDIKFTGITLNADTSNRILSNYHPDLKVSETTLSPKKVPTKAKTKGGLHRASSKSRGISKLSPIGVTLRDGTTIMSTTDPKIKIPKSNLEKASGRPKRDTLPQKDKDELIYDYSSVDCVYWDMDNSYWSREGCRLLENNETCILCQCNKFGLYSIVLSYSNVSDDSWELDLVKWILFGTSTLVLLITIGFFVMEPILLYRSPDCWTSLNLLFCLLAENILCSTILGNALDDFLNDRGKILVGIFANYVFICIVTWTVVESWKCYQTLTMFVEVNRVLENVIGYAVPAFLIFGIWITSILKNEDNKFDWLENYYGWGFIVPIGVFLPVIASYTYLAGRRINNTTGPIPKKNKESIRVMIRGTIGFTLLLLSTTVVGFLVHINLWNSRNVLMYVFLVLHALQGAFLFVYHILLNEAILDFMLKILCLRPSSCITSPEETTLNKITS